MPICIASCSTRTKFYIETSSTRSTLGDAPVDQHLRRRREAPQGRKARRRYYYLPVDLASSFEQSDAVQTINFPRGHGILKAYIGLRPRDPDTLEYEALLKNAYGESKTKEYLSRGIAASSSIPTSVQSPLQRLHAACAVRPDNDVEGLASRLKGAKAIYGAACWSTTSSARRRR